MAKRLGKKLHMSRGATHARMQFQEAKHKRDVSGKFADMPGSVVPGLDGNVADIAPAMQPATKADWMAGAKTSKVTGDDLIKLHVTSNPKKAGSAAAERFAKYTDGMSVADYRKAGGTAEDLAWDRKRGFVSFHTPDTYHSISTNGASPVSQINHQTATGRLANIKAQAEAKAGVTTEAVKPPPPDVPMKASGEPPEPPPPPKPVEAAPKPAAAAPASPASASAAPKAPETPAAPKPAPTGTPEAAVVAKPPEVGVVEPAAAPKIEPSTKVGFYKKGVTPDETTTLNGVELKPWTPPKDNAGWAKVDGQNPDIGETPLNAKGKRPGAGVLITEPDGRVWLVKPTKGYGGYEYTFPKGGQDPGEGLSLQATAIKEAYEESGLKVRITGVAGDFEGDTSVARYYHAVREDGRPADHGWESEAVVLVPKDQLDLYLNKSRDKSIATQHLKPEPKPAGAPPAAPAPKPAEGPTVAPSGLPPQMPNDHRFKIEDVVDMPAHKMVDEGDAGLEWEYKKEYHQYGGDNWVKSVGGTRITDQADFNKKYKDAPLTYLTNDQYDNLGYTSVNTKKLPTFNEIAPGLIQRNRDPKAIRDRMFNGVTTPPIVLKHGNTYRLMAGQSRIWTGLSAGIRVPVKVIDVTPGAAKPVVGKGKFTEADIVGDKVVTSMFREKFTTRMNKLPEKFVSAAIKDGKPHLYGSYKGATDAPHMKMSGTSKAPVAYYAIKEKHTAFFEDMNSKSGKALKGNGYTDAEVEEYHLGNIAHELGHQMDYINRTKVPGKFQMTGGSKDPEFMTKAEKIRKRYVTTPNQTDQEKWATYFTSDQEMWAAGTEVVMMGGRRGVSSKNSLLGKLMHEEGLVDWMTAHYKSRGAL
jgi:8-oxo-dGTP pyrophosphatase MutT (NUDIX family)